jgi:hypothetical protein
MTTGGIKQRKITNPKSFCKPKFPCRELFNSAARDQYVTDSA